LKPKISWQLRKKWIGKKLNYLTPVILVLLIASLLVFVAKLPELPEIVELTEEYRETLNEQVEEARKNESAKIDVDKIQVPGSPSDNEFPLFFSREDVHEVITPAETEEPPEGENVTENVTAEETIEEPSLLATVIAGLLNVLPLIVIALVAGFGIYWLFKQKKHITLRLLFGSALSIVCVCTLFFFGIMSIILGMYISDTGLPNMMVGLIVAPFAVPIGIALGYFIVSKKVSLDRKNVSLLFAGALMGAFLATLIPLWIVLPLMVGISLFDIYSVKRGPIKKIIDLDNQKPAPQPAPQPEPEKEQVPEDIVELPAQPEPAAAAAEAQASPPSQPKSKPKPASYDDDETDLIMLYETPQWSLGLGDLVIYSMFSAVGLTYTLTYLPYYGFYNQVLGFIIPWLVFLVITIAILGGFSVTIKLLRKHDIMPGLPVSVAFALIAFFICVGVLQLVNFMIYNTFARFY
jgi:hypothetical protein